MRLGFALTPDPKLGTRNRAQRVYTASSGRSYFAFPMRSLIVG